MPAGERTNMKAKASDRIDESVAVDGSQRLASAGLKVERLFSTEGVSPFDQVEWEKRSAAIKDSEGSVIFKQDDAEMPSTWSQLATNVVVSKYFYGAQGKSEREHSVRQLIDRVTRTIAD